MFALAALALLVRLAIIAHSHGGHDLRIYVYYSRLPLHGINPFINYRGGPLPSIDGDDPPVEVAVFTGLLAIHDSPTMLRLLFAASDAVLLILVGLWSPRPRRWRGAFMLFYAFNPFVLFAWTAFAEDKTLLMLSIAVLVLALERGRQWLAWMAAAALAVFKFIGVLVAPVLALHAIRTRGGRWALFPIATFALLFALSNLPWFPRSLDAFSRRNARLDVNPPIHASPTLLLSRLGLYVARGGHGADADRPGGGGRAVRRPPARDHRRGGVVAVRRQRVSPR